MVQMAVELVGLITKITWSKIMKTQKKEGVAICTIRNLEIPDPF